MADKDISVATIILILKKTAIRIQERHVKKLRDLDDLPP